MSKPFASRPEFDRILTAEVEQILADPAFLNAPVQSRLLRYLCEQSTGGGAGPGQFAVAVDGLGKSVNYDLTTDSYPRVQISRLRRNLQGYYSRRQSSEGMCVFLRPGDYKLRLAPFERAYPDLASRLVPKQRDDAQEHAGRFVPTPTAANPDLQIYSISSGARKATAIRRWWTAVAVLTVALVLAVVLTIVRGGASRGRLAPVVALSLQMPEQAAPANRELAASAIRVIRRELANSKVSKLASNPADASTYDVTLTFGTSVDGLTDVDLALLDQRHNMLASKTVTLTGSRQVFLEEIQAASVSLVSPVGAIATAERAQISGEPRSGYECFLLASLTRVFEISSAARSEQCLAAFPDSEYRANWLGRRAFALYNRQILAGQPVTMEGPAWEALQQALAADPRDPFANFVAAKVQLARENCAGAETFISRALDNGISYPMLIVTATAGVSDCAVHFTDWDRRRSLVASILALTPPGDAVLHLNLELAAIAIDRPDLARRLANKGFLGNQETPAARAARLFEQILTVPGFATAHRAELEQIVVAFVWSPTGRKRMIERISAMAPPASAPGRGLKASADRQRN